MPTRYSNHRYTIHDKAQNFVVPIPLEQGWHDEQIDELFSSLLGGAGLEGAGVDKDDQGVMGGAAQQEEAGQVHVRPERRDVPLAGLRVF